MWIEDAGSAVMFGDSDKAQDGTVEGDNSWGGQECDKAREEGHELGTCGPGRVPCAHVKDHRN